MDAGNRALATAALCFAAAALIWTALRHSGVHAADWYVTSCLLGCGTVLAANANPRLPPFSSSLRGVAMATGGYVLFQLIPLPGGLLRWIDPARAEMLSDAARIIPSARLAPIAVAEPAAVQWAATLFGAAALFLTVRSFTAVFRIRPWISLLPLFVIAVIEAALGLMQLVAGAPYIIGTYNSRDHYAFLLEIAVPLFAAAGLASIRDRRPDREFSSRNALIACVFWSLALLLVAAVFSSLSRTGAFGALFGLAVFAAASSAPSFRSRSLRAGLLAAIFCAVAVALFAFTPHALLERLFETAGGQPEVRLSFWRESLPLLARFPLFGVGLMGYEPAFLRYQNVMLLKRVNFAHNDYLQYLIELGFIGFSLAAVLLWGVLWPCVRDAWSSGGSPHRVWLAGCLGAFAAVAVHSIVDFNLYVPANVLAFAWIAGFASAATAPLPSPHPRA